MSQFAMVISRWLRSERTGLGCFVLIVASLAPTAGRVALAAQPADTRAESTAAERCKALASVDFSTVQDAPTQLTATLSVTASGDIPAYCQVKGYVAPHVGLELRLPASSWNGKFLHVGCGGMCGVVNAGNCGFALRKGYACVASDMGHASLTGQGAWAYNNLQAEVDLAYRATHVATLAGKAITASYYRKGPERSYFFGCSQGGRQGLVEAQRFPWDFDGIVAGAPVIHYAMAAVHLMGIPRLIQSEGRPPVLTAQTLKVVHEAVLRECDRNDGLADGLIGNPRACRFDPAKLSCSGQEGCLNPAQIAVVNKIYAGPTLSDGEKIYWGLARGSELVWAGTYISATGEKGYMEKFGIEKFRYLTFMPDPGPSWQPADLDLDRDYRRFQLTESLYSAANPDLRRFKAAGGKLLIYGGWNDVLASVPESLIDYYETTERTMGGRAATQEFARLFLLPGVDHCAGGTGADAIDYLTHMERWVEQGQAPDRLIAAHLKNGTPGLHQSFPQDPQNIAFTRPVFPYPRHAVYKGRGDPNDAANFRPSEGTAAGR